MDSSRGTRHKPASRMATGRSNYLTKQTGEYLVAAELSRRGFIATTFTGNVPSYDIVAVGRGGNTALVQVKGDCVRIVAVERWEVCQRQI